MVATLNVNPMQTTNAAGSFATISDGFIQGIALDDPAIRNELAGGILSASETLPMWGGVGIAELIASPGDSTHHLSELGNDIRRANSLSGSLSLTGFSVFDQAHAMINTPQSPVPLALANMSVHFYRLGCGARIPVACDPVLIDQRGNPISSQVSWDFTAQRLVEYSPAYAGATISGATWANTAGGQTTFTVNTDYTAIFTAGDSVEITGVVNTGGTSTSAFNGRFNIVSVTDSTHIVVAQPAAASPGTYASGGAVVAGGGALPVKLLTIRSDNCLTVSYDPVSGFATWNRNDSCALILI